MLGYELLLVLIVFFFTQNVSNLREGPREHPVKAVLVVSGEGWGLALEFYVDDGVVPGLGVLVNLHKLFVTNLLWVVVLMQVSTKYSSGIPILCWLWIQLMRVCPKGVLLKKGWSGR